MPSAVPFADLHAQYLGMRAEIDAAIAEVIRTSAFIRGPFVDRFEQAFATAIGTAHCVSCANGTDSLYIAMRALGVKPGDEVIAPAHSWISTTETITQAGAKVVFCDTDPVTFTIDPAQIAAKITPRTVGIIPVHLYGQPADMDPIMALAASGTASGSIEDCAQAHLARYKGRTVGTFGNAASFSFYPGKNLGAMGDAGAIVTNDAELAERMAMFARHGGLTKGDHQIEGINSRLDGLQAAVLSVKLPHLPRWTSAAAGARGGLRRRCSAASTASRRRRSRRAASTSGTCTSCMHERRDALARASRRARHPDGRQLSGRAAVPAGVPPLRASAGGLSGRVPAPVAHPVAADVSGDERRRSSAPVADALRTFAETPHEARTIGK